jgi:hypothetical protein
MNGLFRPTDVASGRTNGNVPVTFAAVAEIVETHSFHP